ncbi:hypothetical protein QBC35DRAFT_492704 [Podospora australis]|uniref:Secreted protein n=1 Tax=Podospora australis TaxID=1536484 RepID=A0AAN6X185_9PEZI|nr:hypothetical protein QBC35DRAFT_492704 [Podospora australis]
MRGGRGAECVWSLVVAGECLLVMRVQTGQAVHPSVQNGAAPVRSVQRYTQADAAGRHLSRTHTHITPDQKTSGSKVTAAPVLADRFVQAWRWMARRMAHT